MQYHTIVWYELSAILDKHVFGGSATGQGNVFESLVQIGPLMDGVLFFERGTLGCMDGDAPAKSELGLEISQQHHNGFFGFVAFQRYFFFVFRNGDTYESFVVAKESGLGLT